MRLNCNKNKAIFFAILSAISFSVMGALVKYESQSTTVPMILFARFSIGILYLLIIYIIRRTTKNPITFKTKHIHLHISRAIAAITGMFLLYYAFAHMRLLDATLLGTTYPLFVPIISVMFLHVRTSFKVWLSIIIGFIGITFILHPSLEIFNKIAIAPILASIAIAISVLTMKRLTQIDNTYTIMFYYFLLATLTGLILSLFDWLNPSFKTILVLIGIGITGACYQESFVRAAKFLTANMIATVMYLSIICSGLFDWIIWQDIPTYFTWFGILLVLIGAVCTMYFSNQEDLNKKITAAVNKITKEM